MIFVTGGDMAEAARVVWVVMTNQARAAMSHPAFCGISGLHLGELAAELGPRWEARCESGRHERREGVRLREAGAGPKCGLVFVYRLLVTLVHLRTGLTYEALGVIYEVGSSTSQPGDLRGASAARRARVRHPGSARGAPPPSATSGAAPCGREPNGRAECTTRQRCAPRASPSIPPAPSRECRSRRRLPRSRE
ncbi:transposase family protein [Streptomyces mirabilis]|uniref:transposase family protein n=1 Tax=Streptomyces mirabilis TaxID=68239 RepID=UPI003694EFE8